MVWLWRHGTRTLDRLLVISKQHSSWKFPKELPKRDYFAADVLHQFFSPTFLGLKFYSTSQPSTKFGTKLTETFSFLQQIYVSPVVIPQEPHFGGNHCPSSLPSEFEVRKWKFQLFRYPYRGQHFNWLGTSWQNYPIKGSNTGTRIKVDREGAGWERKYGG